ncbi:MAG: amidohydrolase family protein [Chloroflexota bacterium]
MTDFPIIDTHLHIWDPDNLRYPWLDDIPMLNRPHLLADYNDATSALNIEKMVFLQCEVDFSQFIDEAVWVTEQAAIDPRIEGMVPWAPLEKGDGARAALEQLAANPLVKGIRRIIQFEEDIAFCLRPDFVRGVQALPDYNLSFDICINHLQMANTIQMVAQCPNVQFILDHIGKPDIKAQCFDPWRAELRTLADFPNVWCKMSGLTTEADHEHWTREDLKPYIDHVIESFGFERIIFGGDWPVATQATTYQRWVETVLWAIQGASEDEMRQLFYENAVDFYRL